MKNTLTIRSSHIFPLVILNICFLVPFVVQAAPPIRGPFVTGSGTMNIINQGNFETNPLSGWTTSGQPVGVYNLSTGPLYRGSYSLKATATTTFTGGGYHLRRSVPVVGGQRYVMSGFINMMHTNGDAYLASGYSGGYHNAVAYQPWGYEWQFVYEVFDVPTGTSSIDAILVHEAGVGKTIYAGSNEASVSFDDIAITPASSFVPPKTDVVIVNKLTTTSVNPTVTGRVIPGPRAINQVYSISVSVNGQTYATAYNSNDGTFSAYVSSPLSVGSTYEVTATATFTSGPSRTDSTSAEIVVISQPFVEGTFIPTVAGGKIKVDYRYDGGSWMGQVGVFSLAGMGSDVFNLNTNAGQNAFVKEAIRRVRTNTTLGRIIVDDISSKARFDGQMPGSDYTNHNAGSVYAVDPDPVPFKEFTLTQNAVYGVMMVPNGTFAAAETELDKADPIETSQVYPLLTLAMASDNGVFYIGQSVTLDNNPDKSIIAIEDQRGGDGDYNDMVLRITDASINLKPYTQFISDSAWTTSTLGKAILNPLQ